MSNDNIDRTMNMGEAGKAIFEALKPRDPAEQLANLERLKEGVDAGRSIKAVAEEARQASWNEDYAEEFLGGHNAD